MSTTDASTTPSILDWTIKYTDGPIPIPNLQFNMKGAKTIGADAGGKSIYKYNANLQTGGDGVITINNLEWDKYNITINSANTGLNISEVCSTQPRSISPASTITTDLLLVPLSTNSLLVAVTDTSGTLLQNALVRLYKTNYDTSQNTSACGQTFFGSLTTSTSYSLDVSLSGYASTTISNIDVSGASGITVVLE